MNTREFHFNRRCECFPDPFEAFIEYVKTKEYGEDGLRGTVVQVIRGGCMYGFMTLKVITKNPYQVIIIGVGRVGDPSYDCSHTPCDGWQPFWKHPGDSGFPIFTNCNTPAEDKDRLLHFHGYCFCEVDPRSDMATSFEAIEFRDVELLKRPRDDDSEPGPQAKMFRKFGDLRF